MTSYPIIPLLELDGEISATAGEITSQTACIGIKPQPITAHTAKFFMFTLLIKLKWPISVNLIGLSNQLELLFFLIVFKAV